MGIVRTLTLCDFMDELGKSFSYQAKHALYEYYNQLSEDIGQEIEMDAVAIRGDWSEYDCIEDAQSNYGADVEEITEVIHLQGGGVLVFNHY